MQIQELGTLEGDVVLFGGAYSNVHALAALLDQAREWGVATSQVICTGDLVAYCADPAETVALFRDTGCPTIAGNCEKQLAASEMDCGCGFEEGTTCDRLSAAWFAHADRNIGAQDRSWMAKLPDILTFTYAGRRYCVIHGGVTDISRFVWSVSPDEVFKEEMSALQRLIGQVDIVIAGHSGIPFIKPVDGTQWINAGAIGMPPHDGQSTTRFVRLHNGQPRIHSLQYDTSRAVTNMVNAGLTQGYDIALETGYWPSEDVLPLQLRLSKISRHAPTDDALEPTP